jgi:hypothetical protein
MIDALDKDMIETRNAAIHATSEANRKLKKFFNRKDLEADNQMVREAFRIDMADKAKFDLSSPMFSIKGFRESVYRLVREGRVREADPVSAFSALFRALVNNVANNWYDLTPTVYEEIVAVTPSSHAVEPYAPMHRGGIPRRIQPSNPFPEVKTGAPFDIQILNAKFGAITAVPEELIKWDMTGQVQSRVMDIGPNMAQLEDAYAAIRFIGDASSFAGDAIPASATKPATETSSTWPWSTAFLGGGANRPSSYGTMTQPTVQFLDNLLMQQKDANGNKLVVTPDTLFAGSGLKFAAGVLLNSSFYPSTGSTRVAVASGADTALGTTYAENVMKGMYRPVISRYLPQKAWGIGQAHKGLIQQVASGLQVVQETPQAGKSFEQGEFRFKAEKFWELDWIDPRFWGLGNDGSV